MKYNKTIAVSAAAITAVVVGGLVASAASDNANTTFGFGKAFKNSAKHEVVQQAVESGDYDTWVEAVGGSNTYPASQVTEAEFPTLVESHNLMQEGRENFETAKELRESIGLTKGFGHGRMGEKRGISPEKHEAVQSALESADYGAWLQAVGEDSRMASIVTEDLFDKLVDAHNAAQDGDFETARELHQEIGFPTGKGLRKAWNK